MTPPHASKELHGTGGWLAVFFAQMIITAVALAFGLGLILAKNDFSFASWVTAFSIGAVAVTCLTLVVALVQMARLKASGVALAERAIILTFLSTIHLAVMHQVGRAPLLEVLLFGTGSLLIWMLYLGLGTHIKKQVYHIDFSRRMANTYPPQKRFLKPAVRWIYNFIIAGYIYFIASLLWAVARSVA